MVSLKKEVQGVALGEYQLLLLVDPLPWPVP